MTNRKYRPKGINKSKLVALISQQIDEDPKEVRRIVGCFLDSIITGLAQQKKIVISDFGVFQTSYRAPFEGYDPNADQKIQVPGRSIPVFKAGKRLKKQLNPDKNAKQTDEDSSVEEDFFSSESDD